MSGEPTPTQGELDLMTLDEAKAYEIAAYARAHPEVAAADVLAAVLAERRAMEGPMTDETLIGTQRLTAKVEAYDHETGETTVTTVEQWQERDGSVITDQARIDAIRAEQARQAREHDDEPAG